VDEQDIGSCGKSAGSGSRQLSAFVTQDGKKKGGKNEEHRKKKRVRASGGGK